MSFTKEFVVEELNLQDNFETYIHDDFKDPLNLLFDLERSISTEELDSAIKQFAFEIVWDLIERDLPQNAAEERVYQESLDDHLEDLGEMLHEVINNNTTILNYKFANRLDYLASSVDSEIYNQYYAEEFDPVYGSSLLVMKVDICAGVFSRVCHQLIWQIVDLFRTL